MNDLTIVGTVLHSVQTCTSTLKIPSYITETKDGSSEFYVFYEVRNVIEEILFDDDNELQMLGSFTFHDCQLLKNINLSNCLKLRQISTQCFSRCTMLENVSLPENGVLSVIQDYAFSLTIIKGFYLPASIKTLGMYVFRECKNLDTITTPKDVLYSDLWSVSFSESSLKHFIIPKAVKSVSGSSLLKTQIKEFEIDQESPYFNTHEGNLYSKDYTVLYGIPSLSTSITFHPKCSTIDYRSMMWSTVPNIVFPSHIYKFGDQALYLSSTKSVTIENATELPTYMFQSCSLTSLTLPSNLKTLGSKFISGSSLTYLFVPKSVTKVDNAFSGCKSNIVIEFESGSCFSFENGYLYNEDKSRLHTYIGSSSEIEIIDSIKSIDDSVFANKATISSVTFNGNNITTIGSKCFEGLSDLKSITIPNSITSLGSACFQKSGLKNILLPSSLKIVPQECFLECLSLESVIISEGTTNISNKAFTGCSNLVSVQIPSTLEGIGTDSFSISGLKQLIFNTTNNEANSLSFGANSFKNCALESIVFPKRTDRILISAFESCQELSQVDMMETNIKELSSTAFKGCTKLKSIYLPPGLEIIDDGCFENCGFERFSIPASVTQLGSLALGNNPNLLTVSLASNTSLSTIVSTSFRGCSHLREFACDGKSWTFISPDKTLINRVTGMLCVFPPAYEIDGSLCRHYVVHESVKSIGPSAFLDSQLKVIEMHSNVNKIGARAFDLCSSLEKLIFKSDSLEVGVLSFTGIDFHCGFIECNPLLVDSLIDVGVPKTAMFECPTYYPGLALMGSLSVGQNMLINDDC